MPSELHWIIQDRVIYLRLFDEITLEEMRLTSEQGIQLMDAGMPPVHVILDDEDLRKAPLNLNQISNTLKVYRHPALGSLQAVGESRTVGKYISALMAQIFRIQYRRATSVQAALEHLREQDKTVDWSSADYTVLSEHVKL